MAGPSQFRFDEGLCSENGAWALWLYGNQCRLMFCGPSSEVDGDCKRIVEVTSIDYRIFEACPSQEGHDRYVNFLSNGDLVILSDRYGDGNYLELWRLSTDPDFGSSFTNIGDGVSKLTVYDTGKVDITVDDKLVWSIIAMDTSGSTRKKLRRPLSSYSPVSTPVLVTDQPTYLPTASTILPPTVKQSNAQDSTRMNPTPLLNPVSNTPLLTDQPTYSPSASKTLLPTLKQTFLPTVKPSSTPSEAVTIQPTTTVLPTVKPSSASSVAPSYSKSPSFLPTKKPSSTPTLLPTGKPLGAPTLSPTAEPSSAPSIVPSYSLTKSPSFLPTVKPSSTPTLLPTGKPSSSPTILPTVKPSSTPSVAPSYSKSPSFLPT
eukprot:CAMPEP_0194298020 /NCGR_PEP_ID=MMETSP0169-20130528/59930_1 /TAXON_ID=218684 /ORGANISM="Corethron pennatum, Strain L29A3" /LENGTH=373 /DNA_ID=CAMNT_0039047953 /DNA_START=178 /DNA_END=1296 /DNA_ORIENTATION=-